jgi:hypothetical protein
MSERDYTIEVEDADTEGHFRSTFRVDDESWVDEALNRREPGGGRLRFRAADDDLDTEGHTGAVVHVRASADDDVEGHALSIHFPSIEEAEAFRRRLLAGGVIVAAVAVGAAAASTLSSAQEAAPGATIEARDPDSGIKDVRATWAETHDQERSATDTPEPLGPSPR